MFFHQICWQKKNHRPPPLQVKWMFSKLIFFSSAVAFWVVIISSVTSSHRPYMTWIVLKGTLNQIQTKTSKRLIFFSSDVAFWVGLRIVSSSPSAQYEWIDGTALTHRDEEWYLHVGIGREPRDPDTKLCIYLHVANNAWQMLAKICDQSDITSIICEGNTFQYVIN